MADEGKGDKRLTGATSVTDESFARTLTPNPRALTMEALQALRKAGYPKPDGVSWADWVGPRKLNHRHELIALMAANGVQARKICQELGFTDPRMSMVLNTTRMKKRIAELRKEYYGETVQARFNIMIPKAVQAIDDILDNPQERSGVKLRAANELLNRAIGKPKETIEVRSTSAKDIFDYLDRKRAETKGKEVTTVITTAPTGETTATTEPAFVPDLKLAAEEARVDAWAEANLKNFTTERKP